MNKRNRSEAWEEAERDQAARVQASRGPGHTQHIPTPKRSARPNRPTTETPTCMPCNSTTNNTTNNTNTNRPSQNTANHRSMPRSRHTQRSPTATIRKSIRKNIKHLRDDIQANVREVIGRSRGKKYTAKQKKHLRNMALAQQKRRHCKSVMQECMEALENHNHKHQHAQLDINEVITFMMMKQDKNMETTSASKRWKDDIQDEKLTEFIEKLALSSDECLLLKEKMMVSYDGWDEMRRTTDMPLKGSYDLKQLAKQYNEVLKNKLGFEPITHIDENGDVKRKGYKVNMRKLHEWIVDQAVLNGVCMHIT
jgi:hypothetical protein